jgi:hypothetical protein
MIGVVVALFFSRAVLHPVFIGMRKHIVVIVILLFLIWWFYRMFMKREWLGKIIIVVVFIGVVIGSKIYGPSVYRYVALYLHYQNIEKIELASLPITGYERVQPHNSIKTLINQEALSESEDATYPRFVRGHDGKYYFTSCVGPSEEYKLQQLKKNMYEIIHVPANLPSPNFSGKYRSKVDFETGEFLLFSKNIEIATVKRFNPLQYFNLEPSEVFFIQDENQQWIQVVNLIKWKGWLFPRPVFGGVMIHRQKTEKDGYWSRVIWGKGEYIGPDDVKQYTYLQGQNLMPTKVSRFVAESFRYRNGFFAPMPGYHEGDIRIPDLPSEQNPQPFIVHCTVEGRSEGKLYNYFGLEPYQTNKKGLNLSVYIEGDNDDLIYFIDHTTTENAYIGSSAISAKIIESKKNYDWSKSHPVESRPYVREINDEVKLFWLSTIVTRAGNAEGEYIGGSIPEITITDANYGKVVWIHEDSIGDSNKWLRQVEQELIPFWQNE